MKYLKTYESMSEEDEVKDLSKDIELIKSMLSDFADDGTEINIEISDVFIKEKHDIENGIEIMFISDVDSSKYVKWVDIEPRVEQILSTFNGKYDVNVINMKVSKWNTEIPLRFNSLNHVNEPGAFTLSDSYILSVKIYLYKK